MQDGGSNALLVIVTSMGNCRIFNVDVISRVTRTSIDFDSNGSLQPPRSGRCNAAPYLISLHQIMFDYLGLMFDMPSFHVAHNLLSDNSCALQPSISLHANMDTAWPACELLMYGTTLQCC